MESYVEWFDGRQFFTETGTAQCDRHVTDALFTIPPYAFAFRFFDLPKAPDLGPDYVVTPRRQNVSGKYYPGGTVFNQEEVAYYFPEEKILLSNMQGNGYSHVVKHRGGGFQPFNPDEDVVI